MKVPNSTGADAARMSMEGALERKNLPVGKDGVMACSGYLSTGLAAESISPGHFWETAGKDVHPEFPDDVHQPNNGTMSSIISKTRSCTFQENGDISSKEDETDRYTNIPSRSNDYRMEEREESQMEKKTGSRQFSRQIVTLLGGCFNIFVCLVNGFLIQRFGIRAVMCSGSILASLGLFASWFSTGYIFTVISVGMVMGWGSSMMYLSNMVIVTLAFRDPRAKGFALALLTSSGGLGSIIFPNILQEFKKEFGWRGALLIISGVYLNVALSGLLVTSSLGVPPTSWIQNKTNAKATSKYRRLLDPLYGAYLLCALIGFGSYSATLLIAVDFGISRGLSAETGIMLLLIINGTSTGTRFMAGVVQMIPGVKTFHVFCMSVMVSSGSMVVLSWADSYGTIVACFTVYGLGAGGMIATLGIVILEVVGEDMYAVSMGLGGLVTGASNTTLGILMGTLYDSTGSYDLPLVIFGSAGVGVVFFPVIIQCVKSIGTRKSVTIAQK
ncbi:monocarboxylate transporter 6-like [Haliotis rubra]|uniref:monocarboxylate transporter 6-like n=1 Tax=Haliotis rubra TaxID=36100 RepID=UPI001EE504CF|nr:monocarboxylate transporter 6-like [Haliotis rubra]